MDKFSERQKWQKLTQEETDNLNHFLSVSETVVKNLRKRKLQAQMVLLGKYGNHLREKSYQFCTNFYLKNWRGEVIHNSL